MQCRFDLQVYQKVHVLAQWRGAVSVVLQRHAHVRCRLDGQLGPGEQPVDHGAQGEFLLWLRECVDNITIPFHRFGVLLRRLRDVHIQELSGFIQAVTAKTGVGDIGAAGIAFVQEARGAAIGGNHALFYQPLGEHFLEGLNMVDLFVVAHDPTIFLTVFHHQVMFLAVGAQGSIHLVKRLQGRGVHHQFFVLAC